MFSAFVFALFLSFHPSISQSSPLTGVVLDPSGRAVPHAQIAAVAGQRIVAATVADADGRFALTAPAHRFELVVTAPGFHAAPRAIDLTRERDVTVTMNVAAITDAVVVSAAHIDLPLSRVTDSVHVISSAEMRARQAESVADALRAVTGLGVTMSGGRGAVTSIFTRGGESDYTLVLVDGVPLNEFGGNIDLAHLSAAGIDRIEVLRGPQSALHGSGAIAGVIQILSAEGGPARATAQIEGGREALRRLLADARGTVAAWSFGAGVDAMAADGFTGVSPSGARVSNDDYQRTEASAVISRRLSALSRGRVAARWNTNERGFPGPYGSNPAGNYSGIDTISRGENTHGAASVAFDAATGRLSHRVTGTGMRLESDFVGPFGDFTSSTRRAGARYVADWALAPAAGVSAGVDIARESGRNTFIVNRAGDEIPVERTIGGYFAEARGAAGTRLLVTAGARVDQIRRHALAGDASPFGARPDLPGSTLWSFNPRASALLYLTSPTRTNATRVRAGYATGMRPPSAFELSSTDNPTLVPERNRSVEIALEQTLGRGAVHLAAAAFWNRYEDLIITVQSLAGASRYRSDNLSNSKARGLEVSAAARGTGRLSAFALKGGYTWLATEILAADGASVTGLAPFAVGDRLPRRPAHRGFVDVSFARKGVAAFVTVDVRGETLDIEPSFGLFGGLFENPGYSSAAAGASWQINSHFAVFGRVTNVLDRQYEEILGFPAPGRRAAAGVRVAAGR